MKRHSESTLMHMTKAELIKYVRMAERNQDIADADFLQLEEDLKDWEPVRYAEWEWFDELNGNPLEGQDRDWGWRCSGCKTALPDDYDDPDCKPKIKYCSECGAKMDGGENHGN